MPVKAVVARFLRRHLVLAAFVCVASIISAIVYEVTGGGKPKAWSYDAPELDAVDLEGPDRPRSLWTDDDFECLGWRATHDCDPYGPRDEARDRPCDEPMPRSSGYCEVRNRTSGQVLRVMLATCKSWQWYLVPKLSCSDARNFTDFSILAAGYTHPPPELPPPLPAKNSGEQGDKRASSLGCALPVEVWIDPTEMRAKHSVLVELVKYYNVLVRVVRDPNASKFHAKPYAIYNSRFESVLWLDSDNIPVRDPTYLFDAPEFRDHVGDIIFMHRNQVKLTGRRDQKPLITHLQKFTGGDGTAASLTRDLDKYRVQCKMRRLGQYTCFMLNPRTPDGNGTPSLIVSLENTKYLQLEQHAIGFSIEGRGLFNKDEEAEVAKMEAVVQATQDEETAAIIAARERSEKQTRGIFGIVVVGALGLWLRWQWIRRCRKSKPKLETKNSSVASAETSPSHVALAVDPSSPEASGSSSAVFSGTTFNSRRRNSSFQIDDK
ncbi:uncharacterized protein IUM83_13458 [Phytophthora cinnamomi]|uniref:uncharacterized protein n=1 Tax=Phytophthora cinnamomi TaxID=4785 RepID=UPI003559F936|nr:hypothetical protein IUM83_13458 [Phytophthora cinnamomi]